MRSRFLLVLLVSLTAGLGLGAAEPARPNVLFIAIDDLRDWVGFLQKNPQTRTPAMDRLARRGLIFTRAYCAAPVCNPSRAALMSGLRPFTTGVYENNNDWRTVIAPELPLTTAFRRGGYWVGGAGKIYHEAYVRRSEWDDYLEKEGKGTAKQIPSPQAKDDGVGGIKFQPLANDDTVLPDYGITDYGIAQLGRTHDKPFFLAVGLHKPHMPWNVPQKYYDLFPVDQIVLPPYLAHDLDDVPPAGVKMAKPNGDHAAMVRSGRWKEAVQAYLAAIAYTDMNIGRLLDALDRSPYRDNTIVCLWGDHGWHLGEKDHWRKFALWEEATRAPLIWIVPGVTAPGASCDQPVDFMTIYPTLMDLCGLPIPAHVEGRSLRPLLTRPTATWPEPAITTYKFKNHAVRVAGWRYIRYENGDEELYDETADPNEWKNLAREPAYAAKKAELARLLPTRDHADIGGRAGAGAEDNGEPSTKKKGKRKQAN